MRYRLLSEAEASYPRVACGLDRREPSACERYRGTQHGARDLPGCRLQYRHRSGNRAVRAF